MVVGNFAKLAPSLAFSLFCCFLLVDGNSIERKYDEEAGRAYLKKINADIQVKTTESVLAAWAYESNITDHNLAKQLEASAKLANFTKDIWTETIKYPWKTYKDPNIRRQFQKFSVLGTAILSPQKYERLNKIISDMQSIYGKAKVCDYHNRTDCSLQLEPELTEIFAKSRDPYELRYYWEQWRDAAGMPVRKYYKEYVDLSNEAAVLNNMTDNTEYWLKDYEAKDFKEQVEALWEQLRPLYIQLHAYVRRRLREQYGEKHVTRRGPIPAHLLGNMWAQSWGNIYNFTVPYPNKSSIDVTPNMIKQGYTPLRMFRLAEEFFTSLHLSPMPDTFWKNSILEKPNDGRDLICHASAWDFYDGKDFRIKQCTTVTMENLNTVHHEMGHVQYFLQYKNQPLVYKEGTNPGFHEAVGDVMALSVSTPKHLRKIGLLNSTQDDAESEINQLFNMALDKIAFLPFGYLMDQWRWSVFEGKTTEKDYNCRWWQLREKYQGLSPSVARTELDFDPGAKYHTVGNVPYIRYFVSFVIQFQFHRSLCIAAKQFDPNNPTIKPLHKCDIYQSKEAGAFLKKMLQLGCSKPWPEAMEVLTGQRKMDAQALLDYFATLQSWLEKENKRTGEYLGWDNEQMECDCDEDCSRARSSDSKGSFEDDNVANSYAEFVPQDENSFAAPDYWDEVEPSYPPLVYRPKENEEPFKYMSPAPNEYFGGDDLPYEFFLRQKTNKVPMYKLQPEQPTYPNCHCGNEDYLKEQELHSNSLTVRSRDQELQKCKLIKAMLNEAHHGRCGKGSRKNGGGFKPLARRETVRIEDASGIKERKQEVFNQMAKNHETMQGKANNVELQDSTKGENRAQANTAPESKAQGTGSQCILEKVKNGDLKIDSKPSAELLWNAELVKHEAEEMLKHFNLTDDNPGSGQAWVGGNSGVKEPQANHADSKENPTGNSQKSANSVQEQHSLRNSQELRVSDAIPFNDRTENNRRRGVRWADEKNKKLLEIILVGKVSDKKATVNNRRKKSYREYEHKGQMPAHFNAVVIQTDPKNEKPDDIRDHWFGGRRRRQLKTSRWDSSRVRASRASMGFRRPPRGSRKALPKRFVKSVNGRKVNINNILQYFGRLQLLL